MNRLTAFSLVILMLLILSSCQTIDRVGPNDDTIYQYSVLSSLLQGVYDGDLSFEELATHGDTGLGTLQHLDGEMIAIDGIFYQINSEGHAVVIPDTEKTPFAVVTDFDPDITIKTEESFEIGDLHSYIDARLPSLNLPYCIRITGTFSYMKTRSVPEQQRPYPVLLDVLKTQPIFEFEHITGDIIGFRLPAYMGDANAAGYHFHFITEDRSAGGHVLACTTDDISIQIDQSDQWFVSIPEDEDFKNFKKSDDQYR